MRRILMFLVLSLLTIVTVGCGPNYDYTTEEFESALNNGDNVEGTVVLVEVKSVEENPVFGYVIKAGNHLNFVNHIDPEVSEGDTIVAKVEGYTNFLGEFTIPFQY